MQLRTDARLVSYIWRSKAKCRALVVYIHGYCSHARRELVFWAPNLQRNDITLVALDYRGHGQSDGARGHFTHIEDVFDDIISLINFAACVVEGVPIFLQGHSQGGFLMTRFICTVQSDLTVQTLIPCWKRVKGAIILSPFYDLLSPPKWHEVLLAELLAPSPHALSGLAGEDAGLLLQFHLPATAKNRSGCSLQRSCVSRGIQQRSVCIPIADTGLGCGAHAPASRPEGYRLRCKSAALPVRSLQMNYLC